MKTAAIIAEYNPFHNGHYYQIQETRKETGTDYVLVVMSGDFVQRGAPALCDKYLRTQMALLNGADAVIELPTLYALSSAEFFAGGAVTLLNQLGMIDVLSFGSESGSLSDLCALSSLLTQEPENYRTLLSDFLKQGLSFPVARTNAVLSVMEETSSLSSQNVQELLTSPNNILGLEYCKSLFAAQSTITPFTIKRMGNDYHQQVLTDTSLSSASAIRTALGSSDSDIKNHIPDNVYHLMQEQNLLNKPLDCDDFSLLLYYKLLSAEKEGVSAYLDCNQDISDKIYRNLPDYKSYTDFCSKLKSKDLTYTRISRILMHILLDIAKPESYQKPLSERTLFVPYARLLGFRKEATPLLSAIKKNSSIPLISKLADAKTLLSEDAYNMLKQDINACHIYEAVCASHAGRNPINEYRQSPIIL